ncbi:MAG: DNA topoisomerase IV subunit A [Rhodothermales bacterium]|nr:DNA topoisomerase IV subunit A [Rhodothermales bacterium]
MAFIEEIPLHESARTRYLTYALSVITSRALPDLRDGLKPVQRRILYAMHTMLRLMPDGRHRKSATVVGEVMGKLHPHGDTAIYDAMVRMAQDFSLRAPLVDGQGNFGSIDGDNAAAMRYTEAKLRALAVELVDELKKQTVAWRPNYDGTLFEPVVLPARFPNLLVNGAVGIAVGMATNIPPHNLGEVLDACLLLIQKPNSGLDDVLAVLPAPDFPTGGRILADADDLRRMYATGEGSFDVRGEYAVESGKHIVLTSVPYALSKSDLIEKIAEHIAAEKVPQLVDIRDESTDDIRIVLELRKGADPEAAMAYLFKHTPLQTRFHTNLTCLVPTENPELAAPQRLGLLPVLHGFLAFRMDTVIRRTRFDLDGLLRRIHILEGFETVFHALDECIKIIRASADKADAAQRLMHRFGLDEEQVDAILELKLYRLARLEIDIIQKELAEKRAAAADLQNLLDDERLRWKLIASELRDLKKRYADPRRTVLAPPEAIRTFSAEDYIVAEDVHVIVTRDGWVKRQRSYTDVAAIRVRDGDRVGWVLQTSTRHTVAFLTSAGKAYTVRADGLPQTTGYGDPVQKLFDFADRETIVGVVAYDPRILPEALPSVLKGGTDDDLFGSGDGAPAADGPFVVAVSSAGQVVRLPADVFAEPSNKNGRTFMRLGDGSDAVVMADVASGSETVCVAARSSHVLLFPVTQVPVVRSAAKGVIAMRLDKKDAVLGATLATGKRDGLEVETGRGRREIVRATKFAVTARGGKGKPVLTRGGFVSVVPEVVVRGFEG